MRCKKGNELINSNIRIIYSTRLVDFVRMTTVDLLKSLKNNTLHFIGPKPVSSSERLVSRMKV